MYVADVLAISSLHCKLYPELLVVSKFQLLVVLMSDTLLNGEQLFYNLSIKLLKCAVLWHSECCLHLKIRIWRKLRSISFSHATHTVFFTGTMRLLHMVLTLWKGKLVGRMVNQGLQAKGKASELVVRKATLRLKGLYMSYGLNCGSILSTQYGAMFFFRPLIWAL